MKNNDEIYRRKKEESLTAVSFLSALKENLEPEIAYKVALDAFANYMTSQFEGILASTEKNSQERFNQFRDYYESYAKKIPYVEVIKSNPNILRIKFNRCPFFEILTDLELGDLAYPFCLSDYTFTEKVLPGVKFSRIHEITKGDQYCDHTWELIKA